MRPLSTLLLAIALAPTAVAQVAPSTVQPLPPSLQKKHIQAVRATPTSMRPKQTNRLSTAQRAALNQDKPTPAQLPAFTVADRNGKRVNAAALSKSSQAATSTHWLLLYRSQNCLPCDRLMNVLQASSSPDLKSGIPYVIVVSGNSQNGLEKVRANFGNLSAAHWMLDSDRQFLTALKPSSSPVLYAMDGQAIAWKLPGNLGDASRVEKLASAWIAPQPAATTKAPASAGIN
jgi:hypothetical protein